MNSESKVVYGQFQKKLQLGEDSVDLKGKMLYCWPYAWDESVNWDLINQFASSLINWVQSILPSMKITLKYAQSSVIFAFYTSPISWRKSDDPHEFRKILLHAKFLQTFYMIDDRTEFQQESPNHGKFVQTVGRLMRKILSYDFRTFEEVKRDSLYCMVLQTDTECALQLELQFEAAKELKEHFGVTKEWSKHWGRMASYIPGLLSWCGSTQLSHLMNPGLRRYLRTLTGGICAMLELVFLMDGINIPENVRYNVYWSRCYELAGYLPCATNDIVGSEKEWIQLKQSGKRADNGVFLCMERTGCTFEQAVTTVVDEHNDLLQELQDTLKFLMNSDELLHEFNHEEREICYRSIFLMGEYLAYSNQAMVLMPRYDCGLKFTFEKYRSATDK